MRVTKYMEASGKRWKPECKNHIRELDKVLIALDYMQKHSSGIRTYLQDLLEMIDVTRFQLHKYYESMKWKEREFLYINK